MTFACVVTPTFFVPLVLTIGGWLFMRSTPGPTPEGQRVMAGVALYFDVDDAGDTVVAEIRGRKAKAGDLREQVSIARAPTWEAERVGVGSMLGEVSDDGRWAIWLASKERHRRMGPVRLRAVAGGAPIDAGAGMPPFLFDPAGTRVIWIGNYQASSGRGSLVEVPLAAAANPATPSKQSSKLLVHDILPGAFDLLADGTLIAIQTRNREACRAMAIGIGGSAARAIGAEGLDCTDPRPVHTLERGGGAVLFRHAPDANGKRRLSRWAAGAAQVETIADDADAIAIDREGTLWWAAENGTRVDLGLRRAGAAKEDLGSVEGRFVRSVHPVPGGGVWIALADRRCDGEDRAASAAIPACLRLVEAGGAPPPPAELGLVRRIVAPESGWPVAVFAGSGAAPSLLAIHRADAPPVAVGDAAVAVEFSPDGKKVAARLATGKLPGSPEGVETVVLVALETGTRRELSRGAEEAGEIRWAADRLFHAWRARRRLSDPRNGLYRVEP